MPVVVSTTAAPPPPPPVVQGARRGFRMLWLGWDQTEWDLTEYSSGVFLRAGTRGFTMPGVEFYRSTSRMLPGSRYHGHRVTDRDVFWPLFVYHDSSQAAWVERDRAFWNTIRPDKPGRWSVVRPDGGMRHLWLRFESDEWSMDRDPSTFGWASYGLSMTPDMPFWQGDPISAQFSPGGDVSFFGPPGVINISSGSTLGSAAINNPGDVDAWITWTLTGPWLTAVMGVAGSTINVPFPGAIGDTLTVYTQPDLMQAVDQDGNDRTDELGSASFAPVPSGANVQLSLTATGDGNTTRISAELTPLYYRAW